MTQDEINNIINIFTETELHWITGGEASISLSTENIKEEFQKASNSFVTKDFQKASKLFETLYEKYPEENIFFAGLILSSIACHGKNKENILSKISLKPTDAFYIYLEGLIYEICGEDDNAVERYESALQQDEHCIPAIFRLAYFMDIRGNDAEALALYEKCAALQPLYSNVLLNLGILYEDVNQHYKAIECYKKILHHCPTHKRAGTYLKDAEASLYMYVDEEKEREQDKQNQILSTPISDFELSVRSKNCLSKMKIKTLGDLIKKTEAELLSYKNFGETSLAEIKEILAKKNLRLGMGREDDANSKKKERKMPKPVKLPNNQEVMSIPISNLDLSVRSRKCLSTLNVKTVGELTQKTEKDLLACKNFGNTSMQEIKQKLAGLGVALKDL